MPRRFHHLTTLKKNSGNQTSLATISILYHNKYASNFKIYRSFTFTELKIAGYSKHCKSQFQVVVIQCAAGELNFANVKDNLIYQLLMCTAFGLQKLRVVFKPFLHTRLLNFWRCLHILVFIVKKLSKE